jgi:hypothetical protein
MKRQPWRYEGELEIEYKPWQRFCIHALGSTLIFFVLFLFFYWLINTGAVNIKGWPTMLTVKFSIILSFLFTLDAFLYGLDEIIVRTIIKHGALRTIRKRRTGKL